MISVPDISQTYPKESLTLDSRFVVGEGNARDLSSDANTGTIVSGRALSLDGTGDYVDCGVGINLTSGGSVSIWAKASSVSGGDQIILETTDSSNRFAIQMTGAVFQVSWYPTATYRGVASSSVSADTWYHIVGTVDDSDNTALYINGVAQSAAYSTIGSSGTNVTAIGTRLSGTDRLFSGSLSCAKIFDVELTAAQALELYNNPEQVLPTGVSAANLKRYYPLCDYENTSPNSLNGLYFIDCGADKVSGLASNCGMDRKEQPPCPQLGLMPSISRRFFDGSNDWYTGGNGITQSSGLAISAWVIPFNNSGAVILETANDGNSRTGLAIHPTGKAQFQHYAGSGYFGKADDGGVSYEGKLMHIVGCYDGTGWDTDAMKLYVNGSEKTSTAINTAGINGSDATGVGAGFIAGGSPDKKFLGHIVSIAVWGDDISAAEVTEIYNGGPEFDPLSNSGNYASSGDLSHYWKLNNAYTVKDLKGSKDLTRVGGTEMTVIPEGATPGLTVFGSTEEKRADNAVINLDGHSYVKYAHDVNLRPDVSEKFTLSVWIKYKNLGDGNSNSIFDHDDSNDRWHLRIRDDSSDTIQFNFGDGSGSTDANGPAMPDSEWHHIAFVLESDGANWTTAYPYLDGVAQTTRDISARSGDCPADTIVTLGAHINENVTIQGAIAYPKIYARALSANEIKLLYSSGHRVVGGL